MATVYSRINGEDIQRLIARTRPAQTALDKYALRIGLKAERKLMAHHSEGNAQIAIEQGDIDRYVALIDAPSASSPGAALSIEYGHFLGPKGKEDRQWVSGLWIIHDAAGLPRTGK